MHDLSAKLERHLQLMRGRLCSIRGADTGKRFGLDRQVMVENPQFLRVENDVTILGPSRVYCQPQGVLIGQNTSIDHNLWLHCGVNGYCHIGSYSYIGCNGVIGAGGGLTIGDYVLIGQAVHFHSENHVFTERDVHIRDQGVAYAPIVVEDDVWIGARVVVLAGVTIGRGAVVGAGAVVTRSLPPYAIAVGVPARVARIRGDA